MLPLKTLKKQLHIRTKLVKDRSASAIGIIMHFNLTKKHNRGTIDISIWRQFDLSILVIKDCDFEVEIITCAAKLVFFLVDFVKHNKLFWELVYNVSL